MMKRATCDKDGNAVSMTHSLGMASGAIRSPNSYEFAWVHGIRIDGGVLTGAADLAADGMVTLVP